LVAAHADGAFFRLLWQSERRWEAFSRELEERTGLAVAYLPSGALQLAEGEAELRELERQASWQQAAGLPVERLSGGDALALEPGLGRPPELALRFAAAGQVDPPRLTQALFRWAELAGVSFLLAEVSAIALDRGRVRGVLLADGRRLAADAVVVAAGAWAALLEGSGLSPSSIRPVHGQLVRLSASPPPIHHVVFGAGGYLVPRGPSSVLCGSTMEERGFDKAVTADGVRLLLERAGRLAPSLSHAEVERLWSGLRPATADGLPALGPTRLPGLHLAVGLFRNGILLVPEASELVASGLLGRELSLAPELSARRLV
ncbi:MAG: FAD-dependent oxidoreductase, partial [Deltaproteobacteria bacterium]